MGSLVAELAEKLSSATNSIDFDEQTLFLNTSANTVGVGTNAPASKFDVRGTMQVGINDTGYDVKFFAASAGAFMLWDEDQDSLEIRGGLTNAGTLKLTTSEPTVVDGNRLGRIDFQAPVHDGTGDALLVGASIYAEADATFSSTVNSTELVFATGASEAAAEKMRITSTGQLGINTATPVSLLDIRGTFQVGVAGTGYDTYWYGDTSGEHVHWDTSEGHLVLGTTAKLCFHDAGGGENIVATADGHLEVNAGTTLDITAPTVDINASTKVSIDGKVGLGTGADTSSGGHVAVKSDGTGTDGAFFVANNAGTALLKVLDNGKVGIGTTSPAGVLDVSSGAMAVLVGADSTAITRTNTTTKLARIGAYHYTNAEEPMGMIYGSSESGAGYVRIGGGSSSFNSATQIEFYTAANISTTTGTLRMRLTSAGNLGIGVSPTADRVLHIKNPASDGHTYLQMESPSGSNLNNYIKLLTQSGTKHWTVAARSDDDGNGMDFQSNTTANVLVLKSDGKVGIGTNAPSKKFQVHAGTFSIISGTRQDCFQFTAPHYAGPADPRNAGGRALSNGTLTIGNNVTTTVFDAGWGGLFCIGYSGVGQQGIRTVAFGYAGTPQVLNATTWVGSMTLNFSTSAYACRVNHNAGNDLNFWMMGIGI